MIEAVNMFVGIVLAIIGILGLRLAHQERNDVFQLLDPIVKYIHTSFERDKVMLERDKVMLKHFDISNEKDQEFLEYIQKSNQLIESLIKKSEKEE